MPANCVCSGGVCVCIYVCVFCVCVESYKNRALPKKPKVR